MLARALWGPQADWSTTDELLHQLATYQALQLELSEVWYYHWQLSVTDPKKRSQVPKPTSRPLPRRPWEDEADQADQPAEVEQLPLATKDQIRGFFGGGVRYVADPTLEGGPVDDDALLAVPQSPGPPPVDIEDDPEARRRAWEQGTNSPG